MILLSTFSIFKVEAQETNVKVKYFKSVEIKLDGVLDEPIWQQSEAIGDFSEHFPNDGKLAEKNTEVRMIYTDDYLYISAKAYTVGDNYSMKSLMRDYDHGINDDISFSFDTFSDRNNAYSFNVSPYGVLKEGLISRGGVDGFKVLDTNWDTTWEAEAKIYDGYYIVELKIPFFVLKYKNGVKSWRFNCFRTDPQSWVNTTWAKVPINMRIENLAYMNKMVFEKPLKKSRTPFTIIPYALYNVGKDFENNTTSSKPNAGFDVKVPIGSGANLDLTVNPDFSNTGVNEGSTNITRFELNLPEQRQFFLDNADLFDGYGTGGFATPFYSRRIGYGKSKDGNNVVLPIIAGARLTGKINNNLRVGLLDVQTGGDEENGITSNNNLVLSVEQKVFKKSNISAFYINRQATEETDTLKYNRVFGVDFNFYSNNDNWTGKFYAHKSITPERKGRDYSTGGFLSYQIRNFSSESFWRYEGGNFNSDLGFIQRPDQLVFHEKIGPRFYPKDLLNINWYGIYFKGTIEAKPSISDFNTNENADFLTSSSTPSFISDYNAGLSLLVMFNNKSAISTEAQRRFTYLYSPFEPTRTKGATPLPVGGYKYTDIFVEYVSDKSRKLSLATNVKTGSYFAGNKTTVGLIFRFRVQPYFNFYMKSTYDYITLPNPYPKETSILYVGPKFEFTFTKNLYWTTDVQVNSQNETLGINSRVQWRYHPLSDLYVIYRDNYYTGEFTPIRRALFLKATFWLNI
ncbi:MAG: carbohydrate binding family 9 domain-containing protein [Ichthyobacteriaceae bacterium]|nr:carbohydrate binding family 9 domain-containing protein [Ichthyobacteriaceae bacterium]